jgi:hypothetical protein
MGGDDSRDFSRLARGGGIGAQADPGRARLADQKIPFRIGAERQAPGGGLGGGG